MKFLGRTLFSGWFMGILLLVFAYVIGWATFIENDFGAEGSRLLVYNTHWFEILLILMVINFSGMIFTKKLYSKAKLNILVLHLALIIVIIGAGITRYVGYEGQMHIRQGQASNTFLSSDTYLQVWIKEGDDERFYQDRVRLTGARKELLNKSYETSKGKVNIAVSDYHSNMTKQLISSDEGEAFVSLMAGNERRREEIILKEGEAIFFEGVSLRFGEAASPEEIQFTNNNGVLMLRLPVLDSGVAVSPGYENLSPANTMNVVRFNDFSFLITGFVPEGKYDYAPAGENVPGGKKVTRVSINGQETFSEFGQPMAAMIEDVRITTRIYYREYQLPFFVRLNRFELDRYPGSNSPSSFASEVTVIDRENSEEFPYRIFMNHILNYGGYRFFQSSYDNDEKGTILSVNKDYWGTLVTYIGYALLFTSLILTLFTRKTRFARISQQLKDVHLKRKGYTAVLVLLFSFQGLFAQTSRTQEIDAQHARSFSELYVQNFEGRMEPIHTLANKVLVKVHKKAGYNGLTAEQVFLGIISDPDRWKDEPVIKVPEESLQKLLGISSDHASFMDFMSPAGGYRIAEDVEKAHNTKPSMRSKHDKALINADERVNVFYSVLSQGVLKVFPVENDPNNKWISPSEMHSIYGHGSEKGDLFERYVQSLQSSVRSGDYSAAEKSLEEIRQYQVQWGKDILPSETRTKLEIFYNEANIFKKLFPFYFMLGILLIGIFFLRTFNPKWELRVFRNVLLYILVLAFAVQTAGLAIRWYISGHAPWSNGYESMIYIAWATMLAGFIFMKRSAITLGVTATLSGITLLTAHMSWLNPELTNLVPVLKSHWLTIHVATITASYGFLGLGGLVAFLNMVMMIFRNKANKARLNLTLKELNLIIEMALSVGLILLVIGNFLGGIWANESWGRYWGWDPKETWTLVTIILYSFTLHLVLIPKIRNTFTFSFFAFISFGAVMMTYFGVNYYLSGLHSYAAGDAVGIPSFVYYILIISGMVSLLAGINEFTVNRGNGNNLKSNES